MQFIVTLLLAGLALFVISLQKTYSAIPPKELKRRARGGDEFARVLYKAVGYGYSLNLVLWVLIGVTGAVFFVVVSHLWPTWAAILLSLFLIWFGYLWLPAGRVTSVGHRAAVGLAPVFAKLLSYIYPLTDKLVAWVRGRWPLRFHTGLYEREDLLELLDKQQIQVDNRIEKVEIEIARHALTFGDKTVRDVLTPQRVVKTVGLNDAVGPVLMTELHASGHSRFPVYDGTKSNIVGTLYLRDLTAGKAAGTVREYARTNDVAYLHAGQPLTEALQAILATHRQLMIVVNTFEEYVGIVTIEDVLEQVIGRPIVDEFDQYEDMRAVAAKMAEKEHKKHQDHSEHEPSTNVVE
jgi:CBS domain containing-hemolysin-like protein